MMGGVKRHLGIMKSVQSDKGGSTGQIAGVIAFANMWFLNLANLGKQKVHPFVGFLQFLLVLLVGVEFYSNIVAKLQHNFHGYFLYFHAHVFVEG